MQSGNATKPYAHRRSRKCSFPACRLAADATARGRQAAATVCSSTFVPAPNSEHFDEKGVLGWPKRCKLARAFRWEYNSYKRLDLAQLLGQRGVFLTFACVAPTAASRRRSSAVPPDAAAASASGAARRYLGTQAAQTVAPSPSVV